MSRLEILTNPNRKSAISADQGSYCIIKIYMNAFQKAMAILLLPATFILGTGCSKRLGDVVWSNVQYQDKIGTNQLNTITGDYELYSKNGGQMDADEYDAHQIVVAVAPDSNPANAKRYFGDVDHDSFTLAVPKQSNDYHFALGLHITGTKKGEGKYVHPIPSEWSDAETLEEELSALTPNPAVYGPIINQYGFAIDVTNGGAPADAVNPTGSLTNPGDQNTTDNPVDATKNVLVDIMAGDNVGVQSVSLFYKKTNEGSYTSAPASIVSGSNWQATLPTDNDPAKYDLYARVTDTTGNIFNTSVAQFQLLGTEAWGHAVIKNKWNSIGGLGSNYTEDNNLPPHADFDILAKGGISQNPSCINYRKTTGDEGSLSDDATFSAGGYDPVTSFKDTDSSTTLGEGVQIHWDGMHP